MGARAILDFPDEINFGTCPVKVRYSDCFKIVTKQFFVFGCIKYLRNYTCSLWSKDMFRQEYVKYDCDVLDSFVFLTK